MLKCQKGQIQHLPARARPTGGGRRWSLRPEDDEPLSDTRGVPERRCRGCKDFTPVCTLALSFACIRILFRLLEVHYVGVGSQFLVGGRT